MGIAIFDVCDTLYRANTTVGFLRFLGQRGHKGVGGAAARWTSRSHPLFWIGAAFHRLFGFDLARRQIIRSLAGISEQKLATAGEHYVASELAEKRNDVIFERLQAHQQSGDIICLASNSLEPVVAAIAKSIGARHVASRLGYRNGICTGRLEVDLTGRKWLALDRELRDASGPMHVYTDNRSDADLIAKADHAIVIIPDGRRDVDWAGHAAEYVHL